jgi:SPP1 gp7 family putative phage head morphogenesis protein
MPEDNFITEDLFDKKPEEIINWFKSKSFAISYNWQDVWQEAHARSFTVAKAMKLDILQDCKDMVVKAFDEGLTREEFVKQLMPNLRAKGWWGRQDVVNPKTGKTENVQLGSPYRLRTIYDVNTQTAYMSGRYKSQMENVADRPYWQYITIRDTKVRPAHKALEGKVFRYDDPFWKKAYPPNGWRCRCRVRALSEEELKAEGLKVEDGSKYLALLKIDEGWDYNPGGTVLWDRRGGGAIGIKRTNKTFKDFGRPAVRSLPEDNFMQAPEMLRGGSGKKEALKILEDALGISDENPVVKVKSPIDEILIKREYLERIVEKRDNARERYANYILPTLQNPFEIYITEFEDGTSRFQYIALFKGKNNILASVRINSDGSILYNMMQSDNKTMDGSRVGDLVYANKKGG